MIYLGLGFMVVGLFFFFGTILGVHRFPDCYTRMHAAAKGDTLSSMLFVLGIILLSFHPVEIASFVRAAKLLFIIVFLFIASPSASHILISAAFSRGLQPWQQRQKDRNS